MSKVKISTSKGDMIAELYDNETPITTDNFKNLIQKKWLITQMMLNQVTEWMAQCQRALLLKKAYNKHLKHLKTVNKEN